MEHIAIDLGGRESQVCIRSADGTIIEERQWVTANLGSYLARRPASQVIVETCAEAFRVADQAIAAGHKVTVVPATLSHMLGVGERGLKNDQRDARALSAAACRIELPSVHIRSGESRRIKSLCGMRDSLIESRTKLINSVRGWARTHVVRIRSGATKTFPHRVRKSLERRGDELPAYVERQLVAIEALTEQIRESDREVRHIAASSDLCRRLMTVPGVGPITSLRFIATLDRVDRFDSAHRVESYLGLTPGECSSSDRKRRTSITKAGSPHMRKTLIQAAWAARLGRRNQLDPMVRWSNCVQERRGKNIATVALARKLAGVLFAIWRDGTSYDPSRMTAAS